MSALQKAERMRRGSAARRAWSAAGEAGQIAIVALSEMGWILRDMARDYRELRDARRATDLATSWSDLPPPR